MIFGGKAAVKATILGPKHWEITAKEMREDNIRCRNFYILKEGGTSTVN